MKWLLLLVALYCLSSIDATSDSDPTLIHMCDARSKLFGCEPQYWIGGNRLRCANASTQIMSWASKTVRSDCYKVFAGEESRPSTSYVPDRYMHIHIRVACYKMLFRGLLIYAVNKNETKVGEWTLPHEEPAWFDLPWNSLPGHTCQKALMHASASWKPYLSTLYFKAPPAGTGDISFRCLIKYGEANTGAFYWPMTAGDLKLTEGKPIVNEIEWQTTATGQSCTDYCKGLGQQCDQSALNTLGSADSLHEQLSPTQVCKLPYLSGNGADGATYDPNEEFCYYSRSPAQCSTKSSSVRFCACKGTLPPDYQNGASQLRGIWILLLPLFLLLNERSAIALSLIFMLGSASAHNWINSNSRSNGASAYEPCKPPITELPHAQVGPGQAFEIEWMQGHGGFTYFAILHSNNADKMKLNTFSVLDDYVKNAPAGSNKAQDKHDQKFHRKETENLNNDLPGNIVQPNFFQEIIYPNNSDYIYRPVTFGGRVGAIARPDDDDRTFQMRYKAQEIAEDVRVSYKSAKYPWLEAVYKFKMVTINPGRPDTAHFYIPGYGGPGRYIVQYLWKGYRDCIDVDYKTTPVSLIYGFPPNDTRWTRIDHCLFEQVRNVFDVSEIVTDPQYCLDRCEARGTNCYGVNVVPLSAPATAYKFPQPRGAPWFYPNIFGTDIYVPWNHTAFNASRQAFISDPTPDRYLCYAVQPAVFTDVADDFTISNDADDPIFYSTCYYKLNGNFFADYADKFTTKISVPWRFNDKCVDCKAKSQNEYLDVAPKWTLANTCVNCDKEPVTVPPPSFPTATLVESGVRCDGLGGYTRAVHHSCNNATVASCIKQLIPTGRPATQDVTPEECLEMAQSDTVCSNTIMQRIASPRRCYCYTKMNTCCKECSRRPDTTFNTYEVISTPDPTCARGVKSTDGKSCCSASCGAGKCAAATATATIDPVGFCCSNCITRPCSKYGPPCTL